MLKGNLLEAVTPPQPSEMDQAAAQLKCPLRMEMTGLQLTPAQTTFKIQQPVQAIGGARPIRELLSPPVVQINSAQPCHCLSFQGFNCDERTGCRLQRSPPTT